MERWKPEEKLSEAEEKLVKKVEKNRKLVGFLRRHRHEIFGDEFQAELETMYRDTGQGDEPLPPALMCMVLLVQAYFQVGDAEAVWRSSTDNCWKTLLGTEWTNHEPAFSQGGLVQFRERLIRHDMDRRLLERTVELAKQTREFDWKKLPKTLRVAVDSRPLEGAGRVEDTYNLLGHAGRKIVECMAKLMDKKYEEICKLSGAPLLAGPSIKASLDIDWNEPEQKADAMNRLCLELESLSEWIARQPAEMLTEGPAKYLEALDQVKKQDLEPGPKGGVQIRQGVAEDRRICIEDPDMRHGRKSKSQRVDGFKQHIATHLDTGLILACAVLPANRPEEEAAPELKEGMEQMGFKPDELYIDRAYMNSELVEDVAGRNGTIVCRPWKGQGKQGLFGKRDFDIDVRKGTITCPAGQIEQFESGQVVEFDPEICGPCRRRAQCTKAASGRGRTVTMGDNEQLQGKLRALQGCPSGRAKLRDRVGVEHGLAHLANRQGPRARYMGTRKNTFDLCRLAAIQNLETIARRIPVN